METVLLSLFANHQTRYVALVTFIFLALSTYFIYKASRGIFVRYSTFHMPKTLQDLLMFVHIFVSVVPALYLPNNVLAQTAYFGPLFEESGAWFVMSAMVLALVIFMVTGIVLTLVLKWFIPENTGEQEEQ